MKVCLIDLLGQALDKEQLRSGPDTQAMPEIDMMLRVVMLLIRRTIMIMMVVMMMRKVSLSKPSTSHP